MEVSKLKEIDLQLINKFRSNNSQEDTDRIIEHNKNLTERYPFLVPHNVWTGEVIEDYDYTFTELDNVPDGWRKRFGIELCEELREELLAHNFLEEYRVVQVKEKYGTLRWYDDGNTRGGYDILSKYGRLSWDTCIHCGEPATKQTTGWVMPVCDKCAHENHKDNVIDKE